MISYLQIRTDLGSPEARPITMQGWGSAPPFPEEAGHATVEASVPDGCPSSTDEWEAACYDETTGMTRLRPTLPQATEGSAPFVLVLIGLPSGTSVKLTNEAGDAMTVGVSENVKLLDRGTYGLEMTPPFPWMPFKTQLEIK